MSGIVFDFKAIRERRDHLGGKDIIKEYVQPEPVLTATEVLRRTGRHPALCADYAFKIGTIKAGEVLTDTKLSEMMDAWTTGAARLWKP